MKQIKRSIRWVLLVICVAVICCRKNFDAPPAYTGPVVHANLSIKDLRAMHFNGGFECVLDDYIIEGIVVADDRQDNFYKSIILQDSTGGITIRMDGTGLYNDYPVGRKIAVKLKTLWLGDYARMIQLGAAVDRSDPVYPELRAIPAPLFDKFIIKGTLNNAVIPKAVRMDELNDSLQSCLLLIDNLEFAASDTGKTYADAINKLSDNATVRSCTGGSAYVRTSGFANFAGAKIPRGNGTLITIYSVFKTEKQLMLRDTSDVQMNGLRCTAAGFKLLAEENFEQAPANANVAIAGWKNISESGGISFMAKKTGGNAYVEISAFATGKTSVVSWLIMPVLNLNNSANEVLSFQTKDGFDNGGTLQVFASLNFDGGGNPAKFKWTLLKSIVSKGSVSSVRGDWLPSGSVSLSGLAGNVWIAFRYEGADPPNAYDKRTTIFQLDNIRVEGN
jgi:hypothetical protein